MRFAAGIVAATKGIRMAQEWDIEVGEVVRRTEMQQKYGGGGRGGMEPSAVTPNVLLFTSEATGAKHGYFFDGWNEDGTFHFTGEGPVGDQVMTIGNKATLEHKQAGKALRLFQKIDRTVRYLGEFEVPDETFVTREESPDNNGDLRSVFVFRLVPVGDAYRSEELVGPVTGKPTMIPIEASDIEKYAAQRPDEPIEAVRREAALVKRYVSWLTKTHSQEAVRHKVPTPGGAVMYTDVFNLATDELIEAKSSSSRHHVRAALGQILDYERYVRHDSMAVLVPTRPADEMIELLRRHGVGVIWETLSGDFVARGSTETI